MTEVALPWNRTSPPTRPASASSWVSVKASVCSCALMPRVVVELPTAAITGPGRRRTSRPVGQRRVDGVELRLGDEAVDLGRQIAGTGLVGEDPHQAHVGVGVGDGRPARPVGQVRGASGSSARRSPGSAWPSATRVRSIDMTGVIPLPPLTSTMRPGRAAGRVNWPWAAAQSDHQAGPGAIDQEVADQPVRVGLDGQLETGGRPTRGRVASE